MVGEKVHRLKARGAKSLFSLALKGADALGSIKSDCRDPIFAFVKGYKL